MLSRAYTLIMNSEFNGLFRLPKIVRFQLMTVLALMWSVVFSVWIGAVSMIGPSMAAHAILLLGVFFTADIFRRSSSGGVVDHRSKFKDPYDGCTRYDDVWGG
jgi:hypothetical protein